MIPFIGGFSQAKIIAAVILVGVMVSGYFYIQSLRSDIAAALAASQRLEDNIKSKDAQIAKINDDINLILVQSQLLNRELVNAAASVSDLKKRFEEDKRGRQRDLNALAQKAPIAVERAINSGTREALRCNELLTGSPKIANEKNSICPELVR